MDRFVYHICSEDADIGIALQKAKNDMVEYNKGIEGSFGAKVALYEYVLYGDPAANIYVPRLDG